MSLREVAEIRFAIDVMNGRARRAGRTPTLPKIVRFSCTCNCFYVDVCGDLA